MGLGVSETIAVISLVIVIVGHLCSTVWWMSKITTTLTLLTKAVEDIRSIIAKHEATYYTKEEAAREFSHVKQQTDALWNKVDKLQENAR